jgi:6-phosphogluconolactonase
MSEIQIYNNSDKLVAAAAEAFVRLAEEAISSRGRFCVALAGGSTPRALHSILAKEDFAARVDWSKVYLFWGDERCVAPDHADSNFRMARETLLDHVPVSEENIHRMRGEIDAQESATEYQAILERYFSTAASTPKSTPHSTESLFDRLDLVFLGMGDDGHTLSLFPGTAAIREEILPVVAHHVDKLDAWRITLTPPFVNSARNLVFFVAGENKSERLQEVIEGSGQPDVLPSQIIAPVDGTLTWMVDEAAAAKLARDQWTGSEEARVTKIE